METSQSDGHASNFQLVYSQYRYQHSKNKGIKTYLRVNDPEMFSLGERYLDDNCQYGKVEKNCPRYTEGSVNSQPPDFFHEMRNYATSTHYP